MMRKKKRVIELTREHCWDAPSRDEIWTIIPSLSALKVGSVFRRRKCGRTLRLNNFLERWNLHFFFVHVDIHHADSIMRGIHGDLLSSLFPGSDSPAVGRKWCVLQKEWRQGRERFLAYCVQISYWDVKSPPQLDDSCRNRRQYGCKLKQYKSPACQLSGRFGYGENVLKCLWFVLILKPFFI